MKLLLDENLPKRLFEDYEISTVAEQGWRGIKNGELLTRMLTNEFDVLLTFDKNLSYQQNFSKYPITVIVLHAESNTFKALKPLISKVLELLNKPLKPGPIAISNQQK